MAFGKGPGGLSGLERFAQAPQTHAAPRFMGGGRSSGPSRTQRRQRRIPESLERRMPLRRGEEHPGAPTPGQEMLVNPVSVDSRTNRFPGADQYPTHAHGQCLRSVALVRTP